MPKSLVIVESPAKARTIAGFLGADYVVKSSMGHVRDLERSGLAVDVDNGFKPTYVVTKPDVVRDLKAALRGVDALFLATDEDREGEAISWHLLEALKPQVPVHRMVFHEITRAAIEEAVRNSRDLHAGLVDAQETRRIVDRLFGYPVSEVLWRKVNRGLSAGRVQSVAVRLVVERERERIAFRAADWWDLEASFSTAPPFAARLVEVDAARVATGRDFDEQGRLSSGDGFVVLDEAAARGLADRLEGAVFTVASVEERPYRSSPKAPFITSTLQQEGGRKLRLSAQQVMRVAQGLYERGYITYMRTDSTTLSDTAITAARRQIGDLYGPDYLPDRPRTYTGKVKNAQEAHEAIRPAGEDWRTPDQLAGELRADELRIYDLIWKRTVASQMADARGQSVSIRLAATSSTAEATTWAASGRTITFPGYLRAYVEGADDPDAELEDKETVLPTLAVGDTPPVAGPLLGKSGIEAQGHTTAPPARFTEASLVKRLEELGVGRPSTYASIISTILDRGYAWKKGSALVPSWTAFAVTKLLEDYFTHLVDYAFTARMEDDLDEIADRRQEREPWLHAFWFGNGSPGLQHLTTGQLDSIDPVAVNSIPIADGIVVRVGRYGPYLQRGEDRASVPEDLPPDELTVERATALLDAPKGDDPLGTDPATGLPVYAKSGRFGPYVQLGDVDTLAEDERPKMESLLKSMSLETMTLDDALRLLSLPRVVGVDPADGEEITAQNGRYGPFVRKGGESRSLDNEEQLFTVTVDEALTVLARPRYGRGSRVPVAPLRELGIDPVSGSSMVVRDGRYGPYVTDGETNASLRTGDTVEGLTDARAAEMLQIRRDAGPAKRGRGSKKAAKKKAGTKKASGTKKAAATKKAAGPNKPPAAEKAGGKKAGVSSKAAAKKRAVPRKAPPPPDTAD